MACNKVITMMIIMIVSLLLTVSMCSLAEADSGSVSLASADTVSKLADCRIIQVAHVPSVDISNDKALTFELNKTLVSVYTMKGTRHSENQDRLSVRHDTCGTKIYSIYDGHSGTHTSSYLEQEAHVLVQEAINAALTHAPADNVREAIKRNVSAAIAKLDQYAQDNFSDGSTLVMVVERDQYLVSINVGDSRAISMDACGQVLPLTSDHKPALPAERERIMSVPNAYVSVRHRGRHGHESSRVKFDTTKGSIAMSRSIGDRKLKAARLGALIGTPDVLVFDRSNHKIRPKMIIVASDGVWDRLSNQEVADLIYKGVCKFNQQLEDTLREVADTAITARRTGSGSQQSTRSHDDISIVAALSQDICSRAAQLHYSSDDNESLMLDEDSPAIDHQSENDDESD